MLKAPFPYFGGKSKIASVVWEYFHDIKHYNEPFFGSGAVLLQCQTPHELVFTVNDADCLVCNFWRAIKHAPEEVAIHADNPVNEIDLHARHVALVNAKEALENSLLVDPEWYDAKLAGWWAWGACCWIGGGWATGSGCWNVEDGVFCKTKGSGVSRQLPHFGAAGNGVNRQLPYLASKGCGVNRQLPHWGRGGVVDARHEFIRSWLVELQERMRHVRVACGDWLRIVKSPSVTTVHGITGVFLDPPYTEGEYKYGIGDKSLGVAQEVNDWCVENGDNPKMQIILCGVGEEHDNLLLHGWSKKVWVAGNGYSRSEEAKAARKKETLWVSPHCKRKGMLPL